jgi:transcriptional regulator with XRE-family HTH domain
MQPVKRIDRKMSTIDAGAVINRAKELHGLTQDQELAQMMGVSKNALASWKRRASIPTKYLIGMVFGTERTVDWLIDGMDRPDGPIVASLEETDDPILDPDILWMALRIVALNAFSDSERGYKELSQVLNDDLEQSNIAYVYTHLSDALVHLLKAKDKWERSGLVKGKDVIRAVATEAGLSDWEHPDALTV